MDVEKMRRLADIVECQECGASLEYAGEDLICGKCRNRIPVCGGAAVFRKSDAAETADARFQTEQMYDNTFAAKLYNRGRKVISSEYRPRDHVREFMDSIEYGRVVVEIGSGNRRLRQDVINLDIFPFPNVDLTADINAMPFKDGSIEFIVLDSVLEHVPEPHRAVNEIFRVLKPGGRVVCITPFVFPYHGYPANYFHFTKDGLEFLFKDFSERRVEVSMGPTTAMVNLFAEYFAVGMAGENKTGYTLWKGLMLLPVFLFKYVDKLWGVSGRAVRNASHLCISAAK